MFGLVLYVHVLYRAIDQMPSQSKLSALSASVTDSLHSLDSANACGALGRRFESGRVRYYIVLFTVPPTWGCIEAEA